jgi:hypothetical protein
MSPGGHKGRLVIRRDRPCTLKPALRISHSRTQQRPYARRRRAASPRPRTRPLTQTGPIWDLQRGEVVVGGPRHADEQQPGEPFLSLSTPRAPFPLPVTASVHVAYVAARVLERHGAATQPAAGFTDTSPAQLVAESTDLDPAHLRPRLPGLGPQLVGVGPSIEPAPMHQTTVGTFRFPELPPTSRRRPRIRHLGQIVLQLGVKGVQLGSGLWPATCGIAQIELRPVLGIGVRVRCRCGVSAGQS